MFFARYLLRRVTECFRRLPDYSVKIPGIFIPPFRNGEPRIQWKYFAGRQCVYFGNVSKGLTKTVISKDSSFLCYILYVYQPPRRIGTLLLELTVCFAFFDTMRNVYFSCEVTAACLSNSIAFVLALFRSFVRGNCYLEFCRKIYAICLTINWERADFKYSENSKDICREMLKSNDKFWQLNFQC